MIDQEACRIALVKLFVALELFFHTVTSTMYTFEAFGIGMKIREMSTSRGVNMSVRTMTVHMKEKYYWGNLDRINMLLMISLVLHPSYKLKFMNWLIAEIFDGEWGELTCKLRDKVESSLRSLFEEYSSDGDEFEVSSHEARAQPSEKVENDPYGYS
ncbi:hypothetical protein JHK85_006797 [Glycine max]|nr:hypothetical protein JHK85_006797 [Glycine max]